MLTHELKSPPEWIKELEDYAYSKNDIYEVLETFEFYTALIARCTASLHRLHYLDVWARERLETREQFLSRYEQSSSIYMALKLLLDFESNFNWTAGSTRAHTKEVYSALNELILYCFYPEKARPYTISISKYLKNGHIPLSKDHAKKILPYIRGIKLVYLDYVRIQVLAYYFTRKKQLLMEDVNPKENKENDLMHQAIQSIQVEFAEHNKNSISIYEDIQKHFQNLPKEIQDIDFQKALMFARHPEMKPIINRLRELGYVEEFPDFYRWTHKESWGFLAYLIRDKIKNGKKTLNTKNDWEPFCIAFRHEGLGGNARKQLNEPKNYKEFLKIL